MNGLFINQGPVVQVRDRDGKSNILSDRQSGTLYDGPLAVMVNEFSASASEIFAGAIQDLFDAQQPFMLVKTENKNDLDKVIALAESAGHKAHIRDGVAHIEGPAEWAGVLNKLAFEVGMLDHVIMELALAHPVRTHEHSAPRAVS